MVVGVITLTHTINSYNHCLVFCIFNYLKKLKLNFISQFYFPYIHIFISKNENQSNE